jgi:hypothetical protein
MSRIRHRLSRLSETANADGEPRFIVQRVDVDGTAEPTEAEVEAQCAELEAEGYEPRIIRVEYVNRKPEPRGL